MISRRGFIIGLSAAVAAPAIIRTPGLIMPIKAQPLYVPDGLWIDQADRSFETFDALLQANGFETFNDADFTPGVWGDLYQVTRGVNGVIKPGKVAPLIGHNVAVRFVPRG